MGVTTQLSARFAGTAETVGGSSPIVMELDRQALLGSEVFIRHYPPLLNRQVRAVLGRVTRNHGTLVKQGIYEALTFQGGKSVAPKYPVSKIIKILVDYDGIDLEGKTVKPQVRFDRETQTFFTATEWYGYAEVEYDSAYELLTYVPLQDGDVYRYGSVLSLGHGNITQFTVPVPEAADSEPFEIYRVFSEYIVSSEYPNSMFELPPGYPENRSYGFGKPAPAKGDCAVVQRNHEIGFASVTGGINKQRFHEPLLNPYFGSSSFIPIYRLQRGSPHEAWQQKVFNRLRWNEIIGDLQRRYSGLREN